MFLDFWNFKKLEDGVPVRAPTESEFFTHTNLPEALIREFVQNALDARLDTKVKIKVSFLDISKSDIKRFLTQNFFKHIDACGIKLDYDGFYVKSLLLEDFGTTGLDGPIDYKAQTGNFFSFWWAEGLSEKHGKSAGRWGLGKTTFFMASKVRTIFGFTITKDKEERLMGKALLRPHKIDGDYYNYFGYYLSDETLPITDNEIINFFKNTFKIKRTTEPGFSILIPYLLREIDFESIIKGIIIHYFYPILKGELEISLYNEKKTYEINKSTIREIALKISWEDTSWKAYDIAELFNFFEGALESQPEEIMISEEGKIDCESDKLEFLRQKFEENELLAFKIPIEIEKNSSQKIKTNFEIYIQKKNNIKKPFEVYFRSGISIVEEKSLGKNKPVYALFVADDEAISEFLASCEGPAHTYWNERTERFKEEYGKNAVKTLRFIRNSLKILVDNLLSTPNVIDKELLSDIFYIKSTKPGPVVTPPDETPNSNPLFNIIKYEDRAGFAVYLNSDAKEKLPFKAKLQVAYEVKKGNPFKEYDEFDFNFLNMKENINYRGAIIEYISSNQIYLKITDEKFMLSIFGFDKNRNLAIDIKIIRFLKE